MARFENRRWVIITLASYTDKQLRELVDNSIYSSILSKTIDGTKAILKWDGNTPSCFNGMTLYSYDEIIEECKKDIWTEDPEE